MPSFFLQSSPADSTIAWPLCSDSGALVPPNNAVYHMDGVNILGCALRSAHETVTSSILYASESSLSKVNMLDCTIGGILWYQGCNDAADTEYVATELYKTRFPKLMSYIRDAIVVIIQGACRRMNSGNVSSTLVCADDTIRCYGLSIPIVSVAITSTRPMLKHIKHIRQYQINEAKMVVPNMAVVDAYGAALSKDSIHLECKAYIILGHIIKKQLCTLQAIGSAVLSSNVNDRDFVHSCYLFLNNSVSILKFPVSNEMDRSNEALFTSALSRAHENLSSINGYMKYNPAASLVFATGPFLKYIFCFFFNLFIVQMTFVVAAMILLMTFFQF